MLQIILSVWANVIYLFFLVEKILWYKYKTGQDNKIFDSKQNRINFNTSEMSLQIVPAVLKDISNTSVTIGLSFAIVVHLNILRLPGNGCQYTGWFGMIEEKSRT